eukprot:3941558-Rhodomonas_salina.3
MSLWVCPSLSPSPSPSLSPSPSSPSACTVTHTSPSPPPSPPPPLSSASWSSPLSACNVLHHRLSQYRTPRSTIHYRSTAHRVAPYASAVPHVAEQRTLSRYRTSHSAPHDRSTTHRISVQHHTLHTYRASHKGYYHALSQYRASRRSDRLVASSSKHCHHTRAQYRTPRSARVAPYAVSGT